MNRNIQLPCPLCGEVVSVQLSFAYIDSAEAYHCNECNEDFGRKEIEDVILRWKRWGPVLAWVDTFPLIKDSDL